MPPAFRLFIACAALAAAAAHAQGVAPPQDGYTRLAIATPLDEATIHDNRGTVPVHLVVAPPLDAADGDRIRVRLDGRVLPIAWARPDFALEDVDRGAHTLQALVTDARGIILAESAPIDFYVWQASRLFPNRAVR